MDAAGADLGHLDLRGPHDLRHTFSTWLEDAGIPARVIDEPMDALGDLLDRAVTPPQVREEILKATRTGRHASQLGSGAGRTEARAG